jgi:hypothetical protein
MRRTLWIFVAAGLALTGCGLFQNTSGPVGRAGYLMRLADSLEHEGAFQKAAAEYATVAEGFPESSYYPTAVRRAALMFSISPYSAKNDSAAYRWYIEYLSLSLSKPERENVRVSVELLHRILLLHGQITQMYTAADSLSVLTKRQDLSITADSHRMQELEFQLQNAQAELKKIKEIDLRLSKSMLH